MKILLTGCTASQSSHEAIARYPSFTGLMHDAFLELGHEVTLTRPRFSYSKELLNQYDAIFVGLASPSSVSAHYAHGAFALANKVKDSGKLRLIIDQPEPQKIKNTIRDFYTGTDDFYKDFYARRVQYQEACLPENKKDVMEFIEHLYSGEWQQTVVPSMPWFKKSKIAENIPNLKEENIVTLCYDRVFIDSSEDVVDANQGSYWCADNVKSNWTKKISKNLRLPVYASRNNNYSTYQNVVDRMKDSIGTLVSTYQGNDPWWSIAISQSIAAGVPVVTEWRHTAELGAEWAYLPSIVEEMSPKERVIMAQSQKDFYREAVPSYMDSLEKTAKLLDNQSSLLLV